MTARSVDWRFRPGVAPTIAMIGALALLLSLGWWQVERAWWKDDLIARAEAGFAAPAIDAAAALADPAAADWRKVALEGVMLEERGFLYGVSTRGGAPGAHWVTPMALDDGRLVLVDRGWAPETAFEDAFDGALATTEPGARETVETRARAAFAIPPNMFRPDDDLAARRLYGWRLASASALIGGEPEPLLFVALERRGDGPPFPRPDRLSINAPHRGYAATWFGLAATLLGVYAAWGFARGKD